MKKSFVRRYVRNKYTLIGLIVVLIVLYFVFRHGASTPKLEVAVATKATIYERVSVTGKVLPMEKADLSFQKGGVVKTLLVNVGDRVNKGQVLATLDNAADRANLAAAQAKLDDIARGLRPQELSVEQSKVDAAQVALDNARQDALNAVRSAYVQSLGAVTNYTDSLFLNARSANPTIMVRTESSAVQTSINMERAHITDVLSSWKADIDAAVSTDNAATAVSRSENYLSIIKTFMSDLSSIMNQIFPGNSGMTQQTIDADVAALNSGLAQLNQAISSISSADTGLQSAQSAYTAAHDAFVLKNAGNSAQSIAAQAAGVAAAKAELDKDTLVSPIDGIVTRADPAIGEYVAPGQTSFAVQSNGAYKVEAYVAEADIAKVTIGNLASTTLDAYGQNTNFESQVSFIDPAETVLEGVPTYKVTLVFTNPDERIRSGMTANLDILTHEHDGVLSVPTRSVIDTNGTKTVRLVSADGKTYRSVPVMVGLKGSDGLTEITSGLQPGDTVVTYVQ